MSLLLELIVPSVPMIDDSMDVPPCNPHTPSSCYVLTLYPRIGHPGNFYGAIFTKDGENPYFNTIAIS